MRARFWSSFGCDAAGRRSCSRLFNFQNFFFLYLIKIQKRKTIETKQNKNEYNIKKKTEPEKISSGKC